MVPTSARKCFPIGGICDGKDMICVSIKGRLDLSGVSVPQANCVSVPSTGKRFTIRGAHQESDPIRLAGKGCLMCSGVDIPQLNRMVLTCTC